jgi:hypothetical protein
MVVASVRHPLMIERAAAQREQSGIVNKAPTMNCLRFMHGPRNAARGGKVQQSAVEFKAGVS